MTTMENLRNFLKSRRQLDLEIGRMIEREFEGRIRFSPKKFVGDLGELYFYLNAPLFSELVQSSASNDECDFRGILKGEYLEAFGLDSAEVRIEVKTRHAQRGDNHLFGLHPVKFDLLAFVLLGDDFDCRHIGIIRSSDLKPDRQHRIKYGSYYNNCLVKWQLNPWVMIP